MTDSTQNVIRIALVAVLIVTAIYTLNVGEPDSVLVSLLLLTLAGNQLVYWFSRSPRMRKYANWGLYFVIFVVVAKRLLF